MKVHEGKCPQGKAHHKYQAGLSECISAVIPLSIQLFRSLLWHNNSNCFAGDRHDSLDVEYSSHGARRQTSSRHSQVRLLESLRAPYVPASSGSGCGPSGTNG